MLSTQQGNELHESSSVESNRRKSGRGPGHSMQWKFWLLSNYEVSENALTFCEEIIKLGHIHKEKLQWNSSLESNSLGIYLIDLFGDRIKCVKRGPRGFRKTAFLNLERKVEQSSTVDFTTAKFPSLAELSQDISVTGWHVENDFENEVNFFRREKSEFQGQRTTLELQVQSSPEVPPSLKYIVKSHGCQADLGALLKIPQINSPQTWREQILYVIEYLSGSDLCSGILLEEGEETIALIPHITGKWIDLSDPERKTWRKSFAVSCQIITNRKVVHCANCARLKKANCQRKSRKENSTEVKFQCNKRFLSREELLELYKNETKRRRKAELREEYWKKRCQSEVQEIDDDQSDPE